MLDRHVIFRSWSLAIHCKVMKFYVTIRLKKEKEKEKEKMGSSSSSIFVVSAIDVCPDTSERLATHAASVQMQSQIVVCCRLVPFLFFLLWPSWCISKLKIMVRESCRTE